MDWNRSAQEVASYKRATEAAAKYGISSVQVCYFEYKNFRYDKLEDAIAQAERDHPPLSHFDGLYTQPKL